MDRRGDLHSQGVAWSSGSQIISRCIEPIEVRREARFGLGNEVEELIALSLGISIGEMALKNGAPQRSSTISPRADPAIS